MSQCDSILEKGFHDESEFTSYSDFKTQIAEALTWSYERLKNEADRGHGGGKIVIFDILELGGEGGSEEQRFEQLKEAYSRNTEAFFTGVDFERYCRRTVNDTVVHAWRDCMSGKRFNTYYTGSAEEHFIFVAQYKPTAATDGPLTVRGIDFANCEIAGAQQTINIGDKIDPHGTLTQKLWRQDSSKPASIVLNLEGAEPIVLELPPVGLGIGKGGIPVGTIVSSLVPPRKFAEMAGDRSGFDPSRSLWVPADGRHVGGSLYARHHDSRVPDLRGQFLRGLNYSEDGHNRTDGKEDPSGADRKPGDFQPDGVGPHTHLYGHTVGVYVVWGGNSAQKSISHYENKETTPPSPLASDTRPRNTAVFYYIKIN